MSDLAADVVCLYDESGLAGLPWAEAGAVVHCYDLLNSFSIERVGSGLIVRHPWDALDGSQNEAIIKRHAGRARFLMSFPPCTDLAVSGSMHFEAKARVNPNFQEEAIDFFRVAERIATALSVPYFLENPVSRAATLFRKPDHYFHPWEFGAYLPEDDVHPLYPDYYPPRDAYPKKTSYWTGGGFVMPEKKPVLCPPGYAKTHTKLGGKSAKTKRIRSTSPRGVALAVFEAHRSLLVDCNEALAHHKGPQS